MSSIERAISVGYVASVLFALMGALLHQGFSLPAAICMFTTGVLDYSYCRDWPLNLGEDGE